MFYFIILVYIRKYIFPKFIDITSNTLLVNINLFSEYVCVLIIEYCLIYISYALY